MEDEEIKSRSRPHNVPPSRSLFHLITLPLAFVIRPLAPFVPHVTSLAPLFVCLLLIPLLILASLLAGWYVWRYVQPAQWEVPVYLQYGDGAIPYADFALPQLAQHTPYDISVHLVVPVSDANLALGNFMAGMKLYAGIDSNVNTTATLVDVRRPAILMLPPSSVLSPFSFTRSRIVSLDIPLLFAFQPSLGMSSSLASAFYASSSQSLRAHITIGRQDGWRSIGHGEGREVSVIEASLRGHADPLSGGSVDALLSALSFIPFISHVVWFLSRLVPPSLIPILFAFIASLAFLTTSLFVVAACLLPSVRWRLPEEPQDDGIGLDQSKRRRKLRMSGGGDEDGHGHEGGDWGEELDDKRHIKRTSRGRRSGSGARPDLGGKRSATGARRNGQNHGSTSRLDPAVKVEDSLSDSSSDLKQYVDTHPIVKAEDENNLESDQRVHGEASTFTVPPGAEGATSELVEADKVTTPSIRHRRSRGRLGVLEGEED